MTDQELQLELAKLLPDKINKHEYPSGTWFQWSSDDTIKDTEWLYVCHLIEQNLTSNEWPHYRDYLIMLEGIAANSNKAIHASWQQRATAVLKVKGIIK